jgi:hypothetical protein
MPFTVLTGLVHSVLTSGRLQCLKMSQSMHTRRIVLVNVHRHFCASEVGEDNIPKINLTKCMRA